MRQRRTGRRRKIQSGFTLMEMLFGMLVTVIVLGGTLIFLTYQARMTSRSNDRNDLQRSARAALSIMEEKIGTAGLGLPRHLAIQEFSWEDCNGQPTPRLVVASLDYLRQWDVESTSGDTDSGEIDLVAADPVPGDRGDIDIEDGRWLFLYCNPNNGFGVAEVGDDRDAGDTTIDVDNTEFSDAQQEFDLSTTAVINETCTVGNRAMLLVSLSAFGVDCTNSDHPYLYWEENVADNRHPVASNIDTRELSANNDAIDAVAGDMVGLRFRFLIDQDGDGVADDQDNDGVITTADYLDQPNITPDTDTANHDDIVAIEVLVRLRSEERDPMDEGNDYRTQDFVRVIRTSNINTRMEEHIFINNSGI